MRFSLNYFVFCIDELKSARFCSWINIALLLLSVAASGAVAADVDGVLIQQQRFEDKLTFVMTKNALKATMPIHFWTAIAKAPDWRVYMYNSNSKLRYELTFEQWLLGGALDRSNDSLDVYENWKKMKILSSSESTKGKLKLRKVVYKSFGERLGREYHGMGELDQKLGVTKPQKQVESYSCFYAPDIGYEKPNAFLYSLDLMPPAKGIPMEYVVNFKGGTKSYRVYTRSISDTKVAKDNFDLPKGYKLASSPREVFVALNPSAIKEMFNDLDVGTPFGTKDH
jgi:hypothetical protein